MLLRAVVAEAELIGYAHVMIAMRNLMSVFLLCVLLTMPSAWAQEANDADLRAMDAAVELGAQAYDAGDYQTAKAILLPLAQRGHPWAMNMVGLMHDGTGVFPSDPVQECDWYERAALAGHVGGMYNLSVCFNHGHGRPKDHEQMLRWRTMTADRGFTPAMINLASLDVDQGENYRRWMIRAAEHGSRYALVSLWLQGYKDDARSQGMTARDFICVSWHILILDKEADFCD